jgi:hypothetical protein
MNRTKRIICCVALASLALIVLVVAVGMVHAQDRPRFARASESEGDVWVLRMGEDEWELCGLNTPLGESDILETEGDSYAEIEFDNGTILSLDQETRVDFEEMSHNSRGGRTTRLSVPYGNVRIRFPSYAGPEEYLTVDLPTGSVDIDGNTTVRINVRGSKASDVYVYSGQARLDGRDDEAIVRSGDRGYIDSEGYLGAITPIPKLRDAFDLWCEGKYDKYNSRDSKVYLHGDSYYAGTYDLDYHGDWVFVAEYGRCWRPRVISGWYPYCDGHWVWSGRWGWTWVSYEPWGWIPYHYGRWVHTWRWGWVWIPGRTWGPAWVAWVYYDDCIGWGPLCPWGYPCYCYDRWCHGPWTYVYRYSFYHPHWRYRHRRHGRYKYWTWGEKRYKYRDGKRHDKADFSRSEPKNPRVAMKNLVPTDAEKRIMKEEKKILTSVQKTVPRERDAVKSAGSRSLPSKPRATALERDKNLAQKSVEHVSPDPGDRSDKLPPKPRKSESSAESSSKASEARTRESTPAPRTRTEKREESSNEAYQTQPAREEKRESASEQRQSTYHSDKKESEARPAERRESREENVRKDREDREPRRQEAKDRYRSEDTRSTSPNATVRKRSVK